LAGCAGRLLQVFDFFGQEVDHRSVALLGGFELFDARGEIFVAGEKLAHLDEGANNEDAHLDGAIAVEDRGKHGHAMLSEDVRRCPAATPT
jgi:hypothetical protein